MTTRLARHSCLLALLALAGCRGNTLETGYVYTPLGASQVQRRAYYAGPFSDESRAAQAERQTDLENRRPVPGQ